jgi:hypothetical protein
MPVTYNKTWFTYHFNELLYILLCNYNSSNPGTIHWKFAVDIYNHVNKLNLTDEQIKKYAYNLRKSVANPLNTIKRIYKETEIEKKDIDSNNLEILVQLENLYGDKYKNKLRIDPYLKDTHNFKSFRNILLILHTPKQILLKFVKN